MRTEKEIRKELENVKQALKEYEEAKIDSEDAYIFEGWYEALEFVLGGKYPKKMSLDFGKLWEGIGKKYGK